VVADFPLFQLCVYKLSDERETPVDVMKALSKKYPLNEIPSLLFYDNDDGSMKNAGVNFNCQGGPASVDEFKAILNYYMKSIPKEILD